MPTYYEFDEKSINETLETARNHFDGGGLLKAEAATDISANGHLQLASQCISVTVEDHKVCLNLPLGFGKVCLPIPISIPAGTAAKACLSICTTFGIPTGIKVTVEVAGAVVVSQTFGVC